MNKNKKIEYQLFSFAYFPKYEEDIRFLAKLAQPEKWSFSDEKSKENSILRNYLEFTFRRLEQEDKIAYADRNRSKKACFNTGLVTEDLQYIYAYFEENKSKKDGKSPYIFKAFYKEDFIRNYFEEADTPPDIANFLDKPELLIFNPKLELKPYYNHIIENREEDPDRYPDRILKDCPIAVENLIKGAIERIKKQVKMNYKIAVPNYYEGKVELLLPFSFTNDSLKKPDGALALEKTEKWYNVKTFLDLKMAYNNARVIVTPQTQWLDRALK